MALLTSIPPETAHALLSDYGLLLEKLEPMAEGSVNSNFRIWTSGGERYFGRIYEEQAQNGALIELQLVGELKQAGLPVATALPRTNGKLVHEVLGKPFALYPWVDGDILCQARVGSGAVLRVGQALARLHSCSVNVTQLGAGRFGPEQLLARLDVVDGLGDTTLKQAANFVRSKLLHYVALRNPDLPTGVTHTDLFRDNVLWQGAEIAALIDFESAARGAFIYDLMVTLLAWCYTDKFEPELIAALFSGYTGVRQLTLEETAALGVEAALACLRFATTRMTDYSLRTAPGAQPTRNFRRFLARLEQLEAGALVQSLTRLRN
jgi:homoserine kinase type II